MIAKTIVLANQAIRAAKTAKSGAKRVGSGLEKGLAQRQKPVVNKNTSGGRTKELKQTATAAKQIRKTAPRQAGQPWKK